MVVSSMIPAIFSLEEELYIKKLEKFNEKIKNNSKYLYNNKYDVISPEKNLEIYDLLLKKTDCFPFSTILMSQTAVMKEGRSRFIDLDIKKQTECLLQIIQLFKSGRLSGCDISAIGGGSQVGVNLLSSKLSNWKKKYSEVYIIDQSASGLFENKSKNLLDLL